MDVNLKDRAGFCRAYIDDIAIASEMLDLHIEHLHLVFLSNTRTRHHDWALKSYISYLSRYLFPFRVIRRILVLVFCCANILGKINTLTVLGGTVRLQ